MLLRRRIERFLKRTRMSPTRFGREVARDPGFVDDLRAGRKPRPRMEARVNAWLDRRESRR